MAEEYKELKTKEDFEWYKLSLDVSGKRHHDHKGKPETFPCRVVSTWHDDAYGPEYFDHRFVYQETVVCPNCGHTTIQWPTVDYDDLHTY